MATIAVLVDYKKISVNLTNGDQVWGVRNFKSPEKAVEYVAGLQQNGHQTNAVTEKGFRRLLELAGQS